MDELFYTWDEFFTDANKLAGLIAPDKPQSLIVVTKGGMFLGGMLSQLLNISIIETINIESYQGKENKELKILKEARFDLPNPLIVDEITDTGNTLQYLKDKYNAKTAVLFHKPQSIIKPDYYLHETDKWLKFPWEVKL